MSKIDSDIIDYGEIISNEFAAILKENTEYLAGSMPVGEIMPIFIYEIEGFPLPDPNFWQECNHSIISHPKSPLRNPLTPSDLTGEIDESTVNRTPNLVDRYMRMPVNFGDDGILGGMNEFDFRHNHTGNTNPYYASNNADDSDGGAIAREHAASHVHGIYADSNLKNIEPPFFGIKLYQRIQ